MNGKTVLITGSTDGIGKQTAVELARMGATVLIHGRDAARAKAAADEVREAGGGKDVAIYIADFSRQDEVRRMAGEIIGAEPRLDVLINNAGVYMTRRELTTDGIEVTFEVNHLAAFLLTNLLLDLLRRSAPSRVVTVSSVAHQYGSDLYEDALRGKNFDPYGAYATSKLANIHFTFGLARRLSGSGVNANCLHPGVIDTKLLRAGFTSTGKSLHTGASTPVYLASSSDVERVTGRYFVNRSVAQPSPKARDQVAQERLWSLSEDVTGLTVPERRSPG